MCVVFHGWSTGMSIRETKWWSRKRISGIAGGCFPFPHWNSQSCPGLVGRMRRNIVTTKNSLVRFSKGVFCYSVASLSPNTLLKNTCWPSLILHSPKHRPWLLPLTSLLLLCPDHLWAPTPLIVLLLDHIGKIMFYFGRNPSAIWSHLFKIFHRKLILLVAELGAMFWDIL